MINFNIQEVCYIRHFKVTVSVW